MTIIAEFHPQAWVNNYAIDVDPEGPTTADVTAYIEGLGRDVALTLRDNDYPTDYIRYAIGVPDWWIEWSGPFYIRVADSIAEHYESTAQVI